MEFSENVWGSRVPCYALTCRAGLPGVMGVDHGAVLLCTEGVMSRQAPLQLSAACRHGLSASTFPRAALCSSKPACTPAGIPATSSQHADAMKLHANADGPHSNHCVLGLRGHHCQLRAVSSDACA